MKITFTEIPPIGLAIALNEQRYDLVAIEPYTRLDGQETSLLVWLTECATCGQGCSIKSSARQLPSVRRCEEHRGKRS